MSKVAFNSDQEAIEFAEYIMGFHDDPYEWVLACYPWLVKGTPLQDYDGPDEWQTKVLKGIRDEIRSGSENIRICVSSGHGIGKTALVAWIIHWFISTHPNPQIVVTANTGTQLTTKTWRELAKWKNMAINGWMFEWTATTYRMIGQEATWFATATKWSAHNSEAFAGTHEEHVLMVFDEASGIDDIIWEVAAGAFTSHGGIWLAFGNPTRNTGRFYEAAFGRQRKRWTTFVIDARTAKMRNDELIQEWIEDWGEDSDYVRVRVRGLPPKQGPLQFISSEVVNQAVERHIPTLTIPDRFPRLMGFDVARQGDDQSVLVMRQGRKMLRFGDDQTHVKRYQVRDITQLCNYVSKQIVENYPDIVFVDGTGLGAGAVDYLRLLGHDNIIEVHGGESPGNKKVYLNRRIEMWDRMRQWLEGADIPDDPQLIIDLTTPEFAFQDKSQLMKLESKETMKKRGADSPDSGDALALTFYHRVPSKSSLALESSYEPEVI